MAIQLMRFSISQQTTGKQTLVSVSILFRQHHERMTMYESMTQQQPKPTRGHTIHEAIV